MSKYSLQKLIHVCEIYGIEHDIIYNQKKTVCMVVMPKNFQLLNTPVISLNDNELSFVDSYKYLGVFVLSSFMDDDDITRQMQLLYIK